MKATRFMPLVAALATLVAIAPPAHATALSCGDVITHDTVLDSDLTGCPGDGLVIGADNITLDLNGHVIQGHPAFSNYAAGVSNSDGHDRVTVENGTIRDFELGVQLLNARANHLTGLSVLAYDLGIKLDFSSDNVIDGNSVSGANRDIQLFKAPGNALAGNSIIGAGFVGVYVWFSDGNSLVSNVASGNGEDAIDLVGSSSDVVERNMLTDNGQAGVAAFGDFDFIRNRYSLAQSNRIAGNAVYGNGDDGIALADGKNTRVAGNAIHDNAKVGIHLLPDAVGMVLIDNTLTGDGTDGVLVEDGARDTMLDGNVASHNGHDGIAVLARSTGLRRNAANFNAAIGIDAIAGVKDLGRNTATGNGTANCINVVC